MSGALLANHRRIRPFGLRGGESAAPGGASIRRVSGDVESLGATARFEVAVGDQLTIETPGGGGYGSPAGEQG
jgi:5-oxoprolinase (ATP-hydrolysing)